MVRCARSCCQVEAVLVLGVQPWLVYHWAKLFSRGVGGDAVEGGMCVL